MGIQIADGFLSTGEIEHGMVVTGDAIPMPGYTEGFEYRPMGGAVLLKKGRKKEGFTSFMTETHPAHKHLLTSEVMAVPNTGRNLLRPGRVKNILYIRERGGFLDACVKVAAPAVRKFLDGEGLGTDDTDLIIPSQSPGGFPGLVMKNSGFDTDRLADVTGDYGNVHTAGPLAALRKTVRDRRFAKARNTLFLTVGSGITVSLALYGKRVP